MLKLSIQNLLTTLFLHPLSFNITTSQSMKLFLLNLLVLSIFLTYKAQGTRHGKVSVLATNSLQISSLKGSIQDDQLLAKSAQLSIGINRKLMTQTSYSDHTTTLFSKNQKNKHDPKPELKSTHQLVTKEETSESSSTENSKQWKKEVVDEQYPHVINIDDMDYTPARKKAPIHN
ncbi:hypothetical protein QVD17_29730 [Tagetes erecta]|uniref:Uncharacterized protein n=1 Tax=Tagetes erecta TaxID=13708 RepID=A0AAD8K245_TARER|nr:hypothetical protein QVD17_29730 [Tagetes erecta]